MIRNLRLWLPLALLGLGVVGFRLFQQSAPAIEPRAPVVYAPLVRVIDVEPRDLELDVRTHGTVAPRTESDLVPEVSGPVVWVSPSLVSGGFFEEGELLLKIDPTDYEVALERARAEVARARSEKSRAAKEHGRVRNLARREVASRAQLDDALNNEVVGEANVRAAVAEQTRAERDLARTRVRAPFSGRVREERVDVGQFVSRGAAMARLYAVDFVEVRLPVPDQELAFLDLPLFFRGELAEDARPRVTLRAHFAGREHTWSGEVVRTEGEIDPKTRMVHVVASVPDPYTRDGARPPLAVGLFVEAEIRGNRVENVVVLPRSALRGDGQVLVVDEQDRLRFRDVDVLREDRDEVIVRAGLASGERVCVSPLEIVSEGMQVRIAAGERPVETVGVEDPRS